MRLALVVLFASAGIAAAEPATSVTLGGSVGFEDQYATATADLRVGRRVHADWWAYLEGRAGSSEETCGDCGNIHGSLRELRAGAMYLKCSSGNACLGASIGAGYARRSSYQDGADFPGLQMAPYTDVRGAVVGEGRLHLRLNLGQYARFAIEASLALRYERRLLPDSEYPNTGGVLLSLGLVGAL